jgi:hypothetical protein
MEFFIQMAIVWHATVPVWSIYRLGLFLLEVVLIRHYVWGFLLSDFNDKNELEVYEWGSISDGFTSVGNDLLTVCLIIKGCQGFLNINQTIFV